MTCWPSGVTSNDVIQPKRALKSLTGLGSVCPQACASRHTRDPSAVTAQTSALKESRMWAPSTAHFTPSLLAYSRISRRPVVQALCLCLIPSVLAASAIAVPHACTVAHASACAVAEARTVADASARAFATDGNTDGVTARVSRAVSGLATGAGVTTARAVSVGCTRRSRSGGDRGWWKPGAGGAGRWRGRGRQRGVLRPRELAAGDHEHGGHHHGTGPAVLDA